MSGLAHFLEDEGLSTVVVALVREHAEKMQPPRALWVPFELGRPFGTPNDAELQQRVLKAALALLDEPGPGPLLRDYAGAAGYRDDDVKWIPPRLDTGSVAAEAGSALPCWQDAQKRSSRTSFGISGLSPEAAIEYINRYHSPEPMPNPKGMAPVSRARFAVDDIKVLYFETALAEGGHPSSYQLNEWFWKKTLAGKMILDFQDAARHADDRNLRLVAGSLVPAERTYEYLQKTGEK